MTCSICKDLPDVCQELYKGGGLETEPLPKVFDTFVQLNDDSLCMVTDLLRCPECSTHYQRSQCRDSIANGPDELEIRIDRLSDIDAAAALAEIDAWILKYARPG